MLHWFKSLMPRGLYARAALIMMVPIITVMIVLSVVFIQRHFERVTEQMTGNIVRELGFVVERLGTSPDGPVALAELAPLARALQLEIWFVPEDSVPSSDLRRAYDLAGLSVVASLRDGLPGYRAADLRSDSRVAMLWIHSSHGPFQVTVNRDRLSPSNPHQLLVIVLLAGAVMTFISFLFLRNQVRPIRRLAAAAEAFGTGKTLPYEPAGAAEVRAAGHAFLGMRDRIERQIEQRTMMLSGVSHDMRTPLTRMRLTLSLMEKGEDETALLRDVEDMEALLNSFLDFARGQALEDPEPTDPAELVRRIIERRRNDAPRLRSRQEAAPISAVMLRPQMIERALDNLIGNALRYGTHAEVILKQTRASLEISVDDDGPGIPAERREEAKRPFARLDRARNQDRGGGVGLGLAIAEDAMRSHGGRLELDQSPRLGGLRARLVIPI